MTKTMSNAIARRYFLHANDFNNDEVRCCFFSGGLEEDSWGFWVTPEGEVDVDDISSNGELPSQRIVDACVRAAVKYLKPRPQ